MAAAQAFMFIKPFTTSSTWSKLESRGSLMAGNVKLSRRTVICFGMLAPRKFMHQKKKVETFRDADDEADQKNWRRLMNEIEEAGSAVSVLKTHRAKHEAIPRDMVLGTLVRFKQLKKWNFVSEVLEWLQMQHWWDFNELDFLLLITAYGKLGDFVKAERVLSHMSKKGYPPNVISHTALMEAYGKGGQYNKAVAIFRKMQAYGPEPSALTYQIIFKSFVEGKKFKEADEVFEVLLHDNASPLKPDQKMFHMMIYMHKKAGNYDKALHLFSLMAERGVKQSVVTYNSLMSFENNYKEVSRIYEKMQVAKMKPDVVSYALLIKAYGKARREEEALAVFEEMLDASVRPSQKAYNILLDAFAISGMIEQARTVFKSMRRDRCTHDLCSYTTMLSAYINASEMEGAEKFFKRIKQDGFKPNIVTYGTLMKGYAKINDLKKMMEKYEEMRLCNIKPNQTIFTTIMDAHGKNLGFDAAVIWYNEMGSAGVDPDQKAKNILLSLAKTAEEKNEAKELVRCTAELKHETVADIGNDGDDDADMEYDGTDVEGGKEALLLT